MCFYCPIPELFSIVGKLFDKGLKQKVDSHTIKTNFNVLTFYYKVGT